MSNQHTQTQMFSEAGEAGERVAVQRAEMASLARALGQRLTSDQTRFVMTCARGSSDHAATYAKYFIESEIGLPVASFGPSVASIYKAAQRLDGAIFLAISQSGKSPDLVASAEHAKKYGAYVVALVNNTDSPLAETAHAVAPLCAGPERSVAATKSFICSLTAIAAIVADATQDAALGRALANMPEKLHAAFACDWSPALEVLENAVNLFVISRGLGLSIACEAALKFKETCALHAEGYSAAEVKHGPMAIASSGLPILTFAPNDPTREGFEALINEFSSRGARCLTAGLQALETGASRNIALPTVDAGDPRLTPISQIQSFYRFVNALSVHRGLSPDSPPFLKKVTETR